MNLNEEHDGCEATLKLKQIEAIISDFKIHESIDIVSSVDLLASELRMRRAKEIYEIKLKSSIIGYAKDFFKNEEE